MYVLFFRIINGTLKIINRPETELSLISKNIIQSIVTKILNNSRYNLWKNSLDTIEWFENIKHKNKTTFIQFDIIDFYPTITKELLLQSINLAKNYTDYYKGGMGYYFSM